MKPALPALLLHMPLMAALALCAGCKSTSADPRTEVLVQISADALVKQAADNLLVEVLSGPPGELSSAGDPETFDLTDPDFHWPASVALLAQAGHESYAFELNLRLERQANVIARGRVQSAFVKGQTLLLQTTLSAQCLGKLDCGENETCTVTNGRASCQSAAVDSGSLPRVNDPTAQLMDAGAGPSDAGAGRSPLDASADAGSARDAATSDAAAQTDAGASGCSGQVEICDNNLDDDCNGDVDCADSACAAITQCVPSATLMLLVPETQDCPPGYETREPLYQDLKDPGCAGCSCRPEPKQCTAYAFIYDSADACDKDQAPYSAGLMLSEPATTGCSMPIGKQLVLSSGVYGYRVLVKEGSDACSASGQATPRPASWGTTMKLCSLSLRHAGCGIGAFCAPKHEAPLCWAVGTSGCTSPLVSSMWWHSYDDGRSCEPCACTARDGSCKEVGVSLSNDTTCGPTTTSPLRDGEKNCQSFPDDTMIRLAGTPKDPVCDVVAREAGSLTPTLPLNLCCQQ